MNVRTSRLANQERKTITISIPQEIFLAVKDLAIHNMRSISAEVSIAIREHLARFDKTPATEDK